MARAGRGGRPNQKMRTRKALLQAASRLIAQKRRPNLDEIAQEGLVSRATAYRYFPNVDALLLEASLDIAVPEPAELFSGAAPADPVARVERVEAVLHDMIRANEASLRTMLAQSLRQNLGGTADDEALPRRQNRRTPLIAAALEPARREFNPASLAMLTRALALVIGTEAMVACKDVLRLNDADSRKLRRWAIRALVEAARKPRRGG